MGDPSIKMLNLKCCPSCTAETRRRLYVIRDSEVFQCLQCGLKYLDPCLDPEAMKFAYESNDTLMQMHTFHEGYYDYGDLSVPSKTLRDFNRGLSLIEAILPDKGRILDVGYGSGLFLAAARQAGWEVHGIDSSRTNLEKARAKFGLDLSHSDLDGYASADSFDSITFWDVLEHMPDPNATLRKAASLLRPQGILLIAVPNDESLLPKLGGFFYRMGLSGPINKFYLLEHVAYYSLSSLEALMRIHNFALKSYFYSSTDLAKYSLSALDKVLAHMILGAGALLGLKNRLIAVFQR